MEKAIKDTDRVLVICTDSYVQMANDGSGGVGYEKTIMTQEILKNPENRRKFFPVIRNVVGEDKMPTFFGGALYLDLSNGMDSKQLRMELLKSLFQVSVSKPALGSSPFLPPDRPEGLDQGAREVRELPSLGGQDRCAAFSDRFSLAFPGARGVAWFDDSRTISERLAILLQEPRMFREGPLAGWWRGPANLHIDRFEHVEGSHFLMDINELNVRRIAAVNPGTYYRKFVYIETDADEPTGLYSQSAKDVDRQIETFGYANEEYGLVDGKLPVSRAEYDDGAAIIDGRPVDISGRVVLRARYTSPYNFVIAPLMSPINHGDFDQVFVSFLNSLLQGEEVFDEMCTAITRLPRRN